MDEPSELDKFLGPRRTPPPDLGPRRGMQEIMNQAMSRRSDWHCEERLRSVLDAFVETMGEAYRPQSPGVKRSFYASARAVVNEVGESPSFVVWACAKAKRKGITVKDLRSILFLVPEWRKHRTEPISICPICHLDEFYCDGHESEEAG